MHGQDTAAAEGPSRWPEAQVERLKALWSQEALSATVIASQLGVTRNAVLGKVHRLQLPGRRGKSAIRTTPMPKPKRMRPAARVGQARPQPAPAAACAAWTGLIPRLEQLHRNACHWPLGDPRGPGFAFCGRPAPERIYCDAHWALGHAPGRRRVKPRGRGVA